MKKVKLNVTWVQHVLQLSWLSLPVCQNLANNCLWLTGWILGVSNQVLLGNARTNPIRKNMQSAERTELKGLLLVPFWTCEMGHEDSGISALDRQHWPQTSHSVDCKDRFVRTGAGEVNHSISVPWAGGTITVYLQSWAALAARWNR